MKEAHAHPDRRSASCRTCSLHEGLNLIRFCSWAQQETLYIGGQDTRMQAFKLPMIMDAPPAATFDPSIAAAVAEVDSLSAGDGIFPGASLPGGALPGVLQLIGFAVKTCSTSPISSLQASHFALPFPCWLQGTSLPHPRSLPHESLTRPLAHPLLLHSSCNVLGRRRGCNSARQ